jgi:glucosamine-6-phosphate deaminase
MEVIIRKTYEAMSRAAAEAVASVMNEKPNAVLGMATGSTPLGLYQELVRMHQKESLDFSQVTTFNLDEYVGLPTSHEQSYHHFMHENFFKHVNISPQNIHIPSGTTSNYRAFCQWYENRIKECGGIDVQILGIGSLQMHEDATVFADDAAASDLKMREYYEWIQQKKPHAPRV